MRNILGRSFFERSAVEVAPELLGAYLVRRLPDGTITRHLIVEVEAYEGIEDRASHASRGRTPRTEVMFGPAGHWYVYFVYGMHEMLNIVTGPVNHPGAVLIRAVEGINGPGRVTKKLCVTRDLNKNKANRASGLWIEKDFGSSVPGTITQTSRIGVDYAREWAQKPWRFVLDTKNKET
ncbi:MAG TPA: DNA-3-methyladenine glycosylase [Candidatus Paceibacterota bacterium]|nr:DNA-3-methyladenine glycosylase [Candidatus Paceibacterota bacterium]